MEKQEKELLRKEMTQLMGDLMFGSVVPYKKGGEINENVDYGEIGEKLVRVSDIACRLGESRVFSVKSKRVVVLN